MQVLWFTYVTCKVGMSDCFWSLVKVFNQVLVTVSVTRILSYGSVSGVACTRGCVVQCCWTGGCYATLWVVGTATSSWTGVFWLPSVWQSGPEDVIVRVEMMTNWLVCLSEHGVTLTQVSFARSGGVVAHTITSIELPDGHIVSDELADAHLPMSSSGTFQTIFVLFADCVQRIDWGTVAGVGHGSVTKNETIASVSPIFALIKLRVKMVHHFRELKVSSRLVFNFRCRISSGSNQKWLRTWQSNQSSEN